MTPTIAPRRVPAETITGASIVLVFDPAPGDFETARLAEAYLKARGFSVGRPQSCGPRGIIFERDVDIQKWRNLKAMERLGLDGEMIGDGRNGPITLMLYRRASLEALLAIQAERPPAVPDRALRDMGRLAGLADAVLVIALAAALGMVALSVPLSRPIAAAGKITLRAGVIGIRAATVEASR